MNPFREWYEQRHGPYPGVKGEPVAVEVGLVERLGAIHEGMLAEDGVESNWSGDIKEAASALAPPSRHR